MRKFFLALLLACCISAVSAQSLRQSVENGVKTSVRQSENHEWKEAFATCRSLDAMIGSGNPDLHYLVAKERFRLYYRINKLTESKGQMALMENYARASRKNDVIEDMLMRKAAFHKSIGNVTLAANCYKEIFAMRAKGLGANVIVTEVDPIKGIEAVFDGFRVMPMIEAAKEGDIFVTVTGCKDVITKEHMQVMKNGAVMCNAGHFDVEVNKHHLEELSVIPPYEVRKNIMTYTTADGRKLNLLGEGRLVNLACGDGHPIEIMDLSFAMQFLAMKYLLDNKGQLENKLYVLPEELNTEVAALKLQAMGAGIDTLSEEQKAYLAAE